jgi:hypothetical protein
MTTADIATLTILALLLGGLAARFVTERRYTQRVARLLHAETLGLAREAAELAEAIGSRIARDAPVEPAVLEHYTLGEPRTYPGLVSSLARLPAEFGWRAVEFHGGLAVAHARLRGWRDGPRDRVSTCLLVSALSRAAHSGDGLVCQLETRMGWRRIWRPHMPSVAPLMDEMDREDLSLPDTGYWSPPA